MSSLLELENSPNIFIPEEWSEAAESIVFDSPTSPPPVLLICGAKNCGKSTFSRHLLNVFLQRYKKVVYLDSDVGQPEFTPPGFLSLTVVDKLTPDLSTPCLKTPERCFFFGDVSSKRDPTAYLSYASRLYDYYCKEYHSINKNQELAKIELPLIVNTPGWVKGVGYEILVDMLKYIAPSYVVKINISAVSKNLPAGEFWLEEEEDFGSTNLIEIRSARQDAFNRSILVQKDASLMRDLRIMAYFRQCFPKDRSITTIKELAHALASHPPYQVPISSIKIRHLHCQVPSDQIFYSLNATIVGLAESSKNSENLSWCVGLGIVRGIDTSKSLLYVITPVPHGTLEKVDLLLQGFIQIPSCLLQVKGCISPYMSANILPTR
ncbi:polynucleotide 5'-hydroxyl-kinase NOL9 [Cucurbita maxima]|uniref:Polynucleotide 5'-hydroxyl-kinase NOL9 n=1 Tax=Cucurbita maxima TaxID=3661 RepID=A0A6J1JWE3_CUCMA|nr:polynucleotide 5'-hydroxyl-kinase NOL9 [Cucurbita maxima]